MCVCRCMCSAFVKRVSVRVGERSAEQRGWGRKRERETREIESGKERRERVLGKTRNDHLFLSFAFCSAPVSFSPSFRHRVPAHVLYPCCFHSLFAISPLSLLSNSMSQFNQCACVCVWHGISPPALISSPISPHPRSLSAPFSAAAATTAVPQVI